MCIRDRCRPGDGCGWVAALGDLEGGTPHDQLVDEFPVTQVRASPRGRLLGMARADQLGGDVADLLLAGSQVRAPRRMVADVLRKPSEPRQRPFRACLLYTSPSP